MRVTVALPGSAGASPVEMGDDRGEAERRTRRATFAGEGDGDPDRDELQLRVRVGVSVPILVRPIERPPQLVGIRPRLPLDRQLKRLPFVTKLVRNTHIRLSGGAGA